MQISKINSTNFNGLIFYKNPKLKMNATIDTNNIVGIQQEHQYYSSSTEPNTDIIVKNTFSNKDKQPYLVFSFPEDIRNVITEYNKACRNEYADLGDVNKIDSYEIATNERLV